MASLRCLMDMFLISLVLEKTSEFSKILKVKEAIRRTALRKEIWSDFVHNDCSSQPVGYNVVFVVQLAYLLLTWGHFCIPGV